MKIFYILSIFFISLTIFCDDAPVQPVQSGAVQPINNNDIVMVNEKIKIVLERYQYHVEVIYQFENKGKKQDVNMGFPNEYDWIYGKGIKNFKIWENGKLVATKEIKSDPKAKKDFGHQVKYFIVSKHHFKKGEKKTIKNSYSQNYLTDYDDSFRKGRYILKTGALWRDKIGKIDVEIISNISEDEYKGRVAYFPGEDIVNMKPLSITPNKFKKTGKNRWVATFKNIDPNFDIEFTFPPNIYSGMIASSTLKSKKDKYNIKNLLDRDDKTAWVEGEKDFGKGVTVKLLISPTIAGGKIEGAYKVNKIGIKNGYGKNSKLFKANNRIKTLKVTANYYVDERRVEGKGGKFTKIFKLKDSKELQYLKFNKTIFVSEFVFEIIDVYKGKKYNDTCINEIFIYPID